MPIGRIQVGDTAACSLPSVLDYGMASRGCVMPCAVHWEGVPADHALVVFTIDATFASKKDDKTIWKVKHKVGCAEWVRITTLDVLKCIQDLISCFDKTHSMWADRRLVCVRHMNSFTQCLRELCRHIAFATT